MNICSGTRRVAATPYVALAGLLGLVLVACGGTPPAAPPAPAAPAAVTPASAPAAEAPTAATPTLGQLAWDYLFDSVEGFYDIDNDQTYGASLTAEAGGKAKLTESGTDVWGKALIVVPGIDFSRGPILTAVVDKIDEGAAYKILAVANPWNDADAHEVVASGTATGEVRGDLSATGWSGVKKDFNLVLIVEGNNKAVTFDSLHINYTK